VVLVYLLRWQFQPERRSGSWEGSIIEHRRRVEALRDRLVFNLILRVFMLSAQAVKQAKAETSLPLETFPQQCPYELAEVTQDEFFTEVKS